MNVESPLHAWKEAIEQHGFVHDPAQARAVQALQHCHEQLHEAQKTAEGVYLWGPVGRGKTWLMDQFYKSLRVPARRQHFHHFMQWVHQRLFQLTGTSDPLETIAKALSKEVRVLCFDELFVNDIGDAIILGRLFKVMFDEGVVLVCTSNQPPEQLYSQGHNKERFAPAITAIVEHMHVVSVDGVEDHRLHPGIAQQRFWVTPTGQPSVFGDVFAQLAQGQSVSHEPIAVAHRSLSVVRASERVLWCNFHELCEQPLAAIEFMDLCGRYQAILLSDVPCMSAEQREGKIARGTEDGPVKVEAGDRELPQLSRFDDSVRRFIALIDECYDRKVPVLIEAHVPLEQLYTQGYLEFAFRRTLSRLQEMQLQRFGV
ncbi:MULTISPECIES: cell division protein ZapE [Pseudomonas]|uniref:AFG1 family ATPase n=1 Tax=Pseudomonas saxonica TaxID=2600598 RepID=A0A5C5PUC4_9PSED|nr:MULTISPECIES: cell division protein ZapE [Pseudomonas]MCH4874291.1 cell division protein ZapE [Pseudomonas sp. TMW22091]TWR87464.1 AFG1 family ATPase [Pseudomonas saxonica]TWR87523.1 AFG1 family ATPase [Pseudomonas saxonica]